MYVIQHCFICRPSDSTVSEAAGIEPKSVATLAGTARRSTTQLDLSIVTCLTSFLQSPFLKSFSLTFFLFYSSFFLLHISQPTFHSFPIFLYIKTLGFPLSLFSFFSHMLSFSSYLLSFFLLLYNLTVLSYIPFIQISLFLFSIFFAPFYYAKVDSASV